MAENRYINSVDFGDTLTNFAAGVAFRLTEIPTEDAVLFEIYPTLPNIVDGPALRLVFEEAVGRMYWTYQATSAEAVRKTAEWEMQPSDEGKDFTVGCTWTSSTGFFQLYVQGVPQGDPQILIETDITFPGIRQLSLGPGSVGSASFLPLWGGAFSFAATDAAAMLAWHTACVASGTDVVAPFTQNNGLWRAFEARNLPATFGSPELTFTELPFPGNYTVSVYTATSLDWGTVPLEANIEDPDVNFAIPVVSGAQSFRTPAASGFAGSTSMTVGVVMYFDNVAPASGGTIVGYGKPSTDNAGWGLVLASDTEKYIIRPVLGTASGLQTGRGFRVQAADLDKLHVIVFTYDGTNLRTYLDGAEVAWSLPAATIGVNNGLRLGVHTNGSDDDDLGWSASGVRALVCGTGVLTPTQVKTWTETIQADILKEVPNFPVITTVSRYTADAVMETNPNEWDDQVGSVDLQTSSDVVTFTVNNSQQHEEILVPAFRFTSSAGFEEVNHDIGDSDAPFTVNVLLHTSYTPSTGSEGILSYRQNGANRGWGFRRINSTGDIDGFVFNGSAALVASGTGAGTTGNTVKDRTHLITLSHDDSNTRLYMDGSQIGSATACSGYTLPDNSDSLGVGDTPGTNLPFLSGVVVGLSIVEGEAWLETEHDALWTSILSANDMVDDATYPATEVWKASDNLAVGDWEGSKAANTEITKVGTPVVVYVARSRFGTET